MHRVVIVVVVVVHYSKLKNPGWGGGSFRKHPQHVLHRQFFTKSRAKGMNEMLYHDSAKNCAQMEKRRRRPRAGM